MNKFEVFVIAMVLAFALVTGVAGAKVATRNEMITLSRCHGEGGAPQGWPPKLQRRTAKKWWRF
jgi:hypothetical protein